MHHSILARETNSNFGFNLSRGTVCTYRAQSVAVQAFLHREQINPETSMHGSLLFEVPTRRGMSKAPLFPKATLRAEAEAERPFREALAIKRAACGQTCGEGKMSCVARGQVERLRGCGLGPLPAWRPSYCELWERGRDGISSARDLPRFSDIFALQQP